jgi:hypothetical protein
MVPSVLVSMGTSFLVIRSSQQKRLKPSSESFTDQVDFPDPDMPISEICINIFHQKIEDALYFNRIDTRSSFHARIGIIPCPGNFIRLTPKGQRSIRGMII